MYEIIESCQVFTPENKVKEVLDDLGYKGDVLGQKVLENSFGDGAFLIEIVRRYLKYCLSKNIDLYEIKTGLENDIYGIELDKELYDVTVKRLNNLTSKAGIVNVSWNLYNYNTLEVCLLKKFEYIVGNPPYVKYHSLNGYQRSYLYNNFDSCKEGLFDLYYAFIEWSINHLGNNGKLGYIVPNSLFKNKSAKSLRNMILPSVEKISDYKRHNLFQDRLTSVAIIYLHYKSKSPEIIYQHDKVKSKINKQELTYNGKWVFEKNESYLYKNKFGDFFNVQNSIATLKNEIFITSNITELNDRYLFNGYPIEKTLVRRAVSIKNSKSKIKEYMIFPYKYSKQEKKYISIDESDLQKEFPNTYKYLSHKKTSLIERNSDDKAKWYEFGRTQAVGIQNQQKLLIPRILTNGLNIIKLSKNEVAYSGLIVTKKSEYSLEVAHRILSSERFLDYLKLNSKNLSGNSMQVSSMDIKQYMINDDELRWENE